MPSPCRVPQSNSNIEKHGDESPKRKNSRQTRNIHIHVEKKIKITLKEGKGLKTKHSVVADEEKGEGESG
jgi:hypothetical protein